MADKMVFAWIMLLSEIQNITSITHIYLEKGHAQNQNVSIHAPVVSAPKQSSITLPHGDCPSSGSLRWTRQVRQRICVDNKMV